MRARALMVAVAVAASTFVAAGAQAAEHEITQETIYSNAADNNNIEATLFKPAGASASSPVPMVLHSHGWGGSRTRTGFGDWLDAGFAILSFDQRGFGESGGEANVEDPELEGLDVEAVIDFVADLDWVSNDCGSCYTNSVSETKDDPVLFAIGGSYGGGYQMIGAFTETRNNGSTRFNALAPEITWYDLPNSLAPDGVVRMGWVSALFAAGATALPQYVKDAFVEGAVRGSMPEWLATEFYTHSPAGFVEPRDGSTPIQLDIPMLVGQGSTDNLFNLNQGIKNFQRSITDEARERSFFVGYNSGHVIPDAYPPSNVTTALAGDVCNSADGVGALLNGFGGASRKFFQYVMGDAPAPYEKTYNITTDGGRCLSTDSINDIQTFDVTGPVVSVSAAVGPYQNIPIVKGPVTVAGIPSITADLVSLGLDSRVFVGLAVGTSAADALVAHNNVMPIRTEVPAVTPQRVTAEMAGLAVDVPAGSYLYLTVSSTSGMFTGFGGRVPSAVVLGNISVDLPLV